MSVGIVVITRDRASVLLANLDRLTPAVPPDRVVVVDNGSMDGTVDLVRTYFPDVGVVALADNLGAAARNLGARHLDTPLVAFNDDDSWWADGALEHAQQCFRNHPRLALLAARVIVEPRGTTDPVSEDMSRSPLGTEADLPGPSILGFVACGAVVRRDAFLDVGGFHERFGIGGEERLLSIDLAAAGWGQSYVDSVVAHHAPGHGAGGRAGRRERVVRNDLWTAALRRTGPEALREFTRCARAATHDSEVRRGLVSALAGAPWIMRERHPAPAPVQQGLSMLEDGERKAPA